VSIPASALAIESASWVCFFQCKMGYKSPSEMYLADQYRAGRMSLRDVATRLNQSLGDTLESLQRLGIGGNVGADDTLAAFTSLVGIS
jgi:hypothetical protein